MSSYWGIGRFLGSLRDFYNELNPATLTGAIDVVVVEQPNGDYLCSPFHVRFGKMGVLRSKEKVVDVMINEMPTLIHMKLSDSGEAFFVESVDDGDDVPVHLATSPLPSSLEAMKQGIAELRGTNVAGRDSSQSRSTSPELVLQDNRPESDGLYKQSKDNMPKRKILSQGSVSTSQAKITENEMRQQQPKPSSSSSTTQPQQSQQLRRDNSIYMSCTSEMPALDKKILRQLLTRRRRPEASFEQRKRSRSWHGESFEFRRFPMDVSHQASRRQMLRHSRSYAISQRKSSAAIPVGARTGRNSTCWKTPPETTPRWTPSRADDQAGGPADLFIGPPRAQFTINDDIFQMDCVEEDYRRADEARLSRSLGANSILETSRNSSLRTSGTHSNEFSRELPERASERTESDIPEKLIDPETPLDVSRSPSPSPSESEAEQIQRVIKEGDALGKVLNQAGGTDPDETWKWAKNGSKNFKNQMSAEDGQAAGWNLFGFMRRYPRQPEDGIYLDDLLKDKEVDPKLADRYLTKRHLRSEDSLPTTSAMSRGGGTEESNADRLIQTSDSSSDAVTLIGEKSDPALTGPETVDLGPPQSPRSDRGYGSNPSSIISSDDTRRWFFDEGRFHELLGDMAVSLCGGLEKQATVPEELFNAHLVTYDQLNSSPDLLLNQDLVIRIGGKFYNWRVAGPILISVVLFQQPLSESAISTLLNKYQPKPQIEVSANSANASNPSNATGMSSYFWWRRTGSTSESQKPENIGQKLEKISPSVEITTVQTPPSQPDVSNKCVDASISDEAPGFSRRFTGSGSYLPTDFHYDDRGAMSDSELEEARKIPVTTKARYKKSLRLTSDQLKSLNLKRNVPNQARFSVTTKYQGTTFCECEIWLWRHDDKIIISDIDGTITKSDVLGHILPRFGGGFWAHVGVAELFSRVLKNDYKILYLSARAIGMATQTKEYLRSIHQDGYTLPAGPLFLSPTSIFNALHREVIEKKPEIFKTSCLRDLGALFPSGSNPFYGGFGNRPNDTIAYMAVGVPLRRIYSIDPTGKVMFVDKGLVSSYPHIGTLVDLIFPPLNQTESKYIEAKKAKCTISEDFASAIFWRNPLPEIDLGKFPKPAEKHQKTAATKKK